MNNKSSLPVELSDIQAAKKRIASRVFMTPLLPSEPLSRRLGCSVRFKAECLQYTGSFKARGSCNAVYSLSDEQAEQGVVTHSSGNHAAALARAASLRGVPAHIVMPRNSSRNKVASVRSYGVEPVLCEPTIQSRQAAAKQLQKATGANLVPPYDDPRVIAGQGTVGLEILEQADAIDTILVPVGGGGLLSGILVAVKSLRPEIEIIAVEPHWADDAARSLQSGKIEMPERYDTIADGLRTPLGTNTFPIIQSLLDDILLVEESEIITATKAIPRSVRVVAEPSGAVTLAGLTRFQDRFAGKNVIAVISGGNLDLNSFDLSEKG